VFRVVFLLHPVKTPVGASIANPPPDCSPVDGSLLGFWDKRRWHGFCGRWRSLGSEGDRRRGWFIGMRFVWLIGVRLGWRVIDLWRNIGILEYPRTGIL